MWTNNRVCPVCNQQLFQVTLHGRLAHFCAQKHGHAVATSVMRRWLTDESRPNFDRALRSSVPGKRPCPFCRRAMKNFRFLDILDHCEICGIAWLDANEEKRMPVREQAELEAESGIDVEISRGWKFRPGYSPYEDIKGDKRSFPIITIVLILACTIISHYAIRGGFVNYVYDSRAPFRLFGLPLILSIFAHANMRHLIGNMVFFFIPAVYLEATLGEVVLLQIFILSGIIGSVFQGFFFHGISLGASGAIAGVYTALCITQPQAVKVFQLNMISRAITAKIRVPLPFIFLIWLSGQSMGVFKQYLGVGHGVGYYAHLGGILLAFVYVFATDLKVLTPRQTNPGR